MKTNKHTSVLLNWRTQLQAQDYPVENSICSFSYLEGNSALVSHLILKLSITGKESILHLWSVLCTSCHFCVLQCKLGLQLGKQLSCLCYSNVLVFPQLSLEVLNPPDYLPKIRTIKHSVMCQTFLDSYNSIFALLRDTFFLVMHSVTSSGKVVNDV